MAQETALPLFKTLPFWAKNYAAPGVDDQRGIQDLIECETLEVVRAFENELRAVTNGLYHEPALIQMLGRNRKDRHGGYEEWARLMLMWLATYQKRA